MNLYLTHELPVISDLNPFNLKLISFFLKSDE